MSDFIEYQNAKEKSRTAYAEYNYASTKLTNAKIHERLAEIKSQSEPLDGLIDKRLSERERLYAAAFYVVIGRLPSNPH